MKVNISWLDSIFIVTLLSNSINHVEIMWDPNREPKEWT